ncbi:MAG: 6-bladed beta-propeller [Paramuribaculum sp.]|nr:6-bladed beta-propeller [Paramuribaculum sp.]
MTLKSKVVLPAISALAILSTGCGKGADGNDVVTIDLASAVEGEPVNHLKATDVVYTPLDTAAAAMFSELGNIVGLAGDTVIIHDMNDSEDRLILFTLADGKMVGQINHKGNGPGEYQWIEAVYIDRPAHEVVINTPYGVAHRYTMDDKYIDSKHYTPPYKSIRLSIGSLDDCINMYGEFDGGFFIHQYDRDFTKIDSIKVDGYKLGYRSGIFQTVGEYAILSMVDTLYSITPGKLEKFAIIDRKGKTITPEIEEEFNKMMRSDRESARNMQAQNITLDYIMIDNDYIIIPSFYNNANSYDIFRRSDGALLTHIPYSWEEENKVGFEFEYSGAKMRVLPRFTQDGRWYAIIGEEQAVGPNGEPNDGDLNAAIVSFKLEEE